MNSAMFFIPIDTPNPSEAELLDAAIRHIDGAMTAKVMPSEFAILRAALEQLTERRGQSIIRGQIASLESKIAALRAQLRD